MKLLKMTLRNFKVATHLVFEPQGSNATIYAPNGSGKTTHFDAFTWLFFDKDSEGRSKFGIKNRDSSGKIRHGLDYEVELLVDLNGEQVTLTKTHKEKNEGVRGVQKFTGNTNVYKRNGVAINEGPFLDYIKEICPEQTFRLLSDPLYFSLKMKWEERRRVLLETCGNVSDEEVLALNFEQFERLPVILGRHKIDDYRDIAKARIEVIKKSLKDFQPRIDEVQRDMPTEESVSGENAPNPERVTALNAEIQAYQKQRAEFASGGAVAQKTLERRVVESELLDLETRLRRESSYGHDAALREVNVQAGVVNEIAGKITSKQSQIDSAEPIITKLKADADTLRAKVLGLYEETYTASVEESCPSCGQPLPSDQVEAARERALDAYNLTKSTEIEKIQSEGKGLVERIAKLEEGIANARLAIEELNKSLELETSKHLELKSAAEQMTTVEVDFTTHPEHARLTQLKARLQSEIDGLGSGNEAELRRIDGEIATANRTLEFLRAAQVRFDNRASKLRRKDELMAEEKKLSVELETLQQNHDLIDEFIVAKVKMLTDRINSKFDLVRWQLFDTRVKGSVIECCEATINGKPFTTELSTSERVKAGLDIIRTLSLEIGFAPPIFIDNAEGSHDLPPTPGQQIRLWATLPGSELRYAFGDHVSYETATVPTQKEEVLF